MTAPDLHARAVLSGLPVCLHCLRAWPCGEQVPA